MKKQQKRKGFEWYRMLTKKQQKQWRRNTLNYGKKSTYLNFILNRVETLEHFLFKSFYFGDTKQGFEYWNRIANLDK